MSAFEAGRTAREVDFICRYAPLPQFRRVLDVCCGMGRHARTLVARGYSVTGVERDCAAIAKARELSCGVDYIQMDVRDYQPTQSAYDLAIIMSQSFGYFDNEANRDLLFRLSDSLQPGGRIILDLWNPDFFVTRRVERELKTPVGVVRETKAVKDGRLLVHLDYPDGREDDFDWQLFTPTEMEGFAISAGLTLFSACTNFIPATSPDPDVPRIQFILERQRKS